MRMLLPNMAAGFRGDNIIHNSNNGPLGEFATGEKWQVFSPSVRDSCLCWVETSWSQYMLVPLWSLQPLAITPVSELHFSSEGKGEKTNNESRPCPPCGCCSTSISYPEVPIGRVLKSTVEKFPTGCTVAQNKHPRRQRSWQCSPPLS